MIFKCMARFFKTSTAENFVLFKIQLRLFVYLLICKLRCFCSFFCFIFYCIMSGINIIALELMLLLPLWSIFFFSGIEQVWFFELFIAQLLLEICFVRKTTHSNSCNESPPSSCHFSQFNESMNPKIAERFLLLRTCLTFTGNVSSNICASCISSRFPCWHQNA